LSPKRSATKSAIRLFAAIALRLIVAVTVQLRLFVAKATGACLQSAELSRFHNIFVPAAILCYRWSCQLCGCDKGMHVWLRNSAVVTSQTTRAAAHDKALNQNKLLSSPARGSIYLLGLDGFFKF